MIGEKIKKRRLELGMSQQELADKTGYSARSAINKIESGERDVKRSKVEVFASALKTTPEYLMGWEENSDDKPSPISDSDLKFALFNGQDGITDEMLEEVRQFAEFVKNKK